jgi:hypothetical protein
MQSGQLFWESGAGGQWSWSNINVSSFAAEGCFS